MLQYRFQRPEVVRAALTHTSVGDVGRPAEIERLEFLGDAVLSLSITDLLMRARPGANEGELTRVRARLVNTTALARKARAIGLGDLLVLGKGEEKSGGRHKSSILAGALEAILGGVFVDGGFEPARRAVELLFGEEARTATLGDEDAKTALQELTQRRFRQLPVYQTLRVEGPDHARDFLVEVAVNGRVVGRGSGRSKRLAAQAAAREALEALRREAAEGEGAAHE
jgi:ribonuclease-3